MTPERRTQDFVFDLANRPLPPRFSAPGVVAGLVLPLALALGAFLLAFGLRPDLGAALQGMAVQAKTLLPLALFGLALWLALASARPGAALRLWPLALPALAAAALVIHRLAVRPPAPVLPEILGQTALACLASVTALSALPLLAGLWLLRRGAPTRPGLAGALVGLAAAGGVTAGYALHCTEDSPLFFVTWYGLAMLGVTALGASLGRRLLRW